MKHQENTISLSMAINSHLSDAMIEISCGNTDEAHRRLHFIRTVLLCTEGLQGQRIADNTLNTLWEVSAHQYNELYASKELI